MVATYRWYWGIFRDKDQKNTDNHSKKYTHLRKYKWGNQSIQRCFKIPESRPAREIYHVLYFSRESTCYYSPSRTRISQKKILFHAARRRDRTKYSWIYNDEPRRKRPRIHTSSNESGGWNIIGPIPEMSNKYRNEYTMTLSYTIWHGNYRTR